MIGGEQLAGMLRRKRLDPERTRQRDERQIEAVFEGLLGTGIRIVIARVYRIRRLARQLEGPATEARRRASRSQGLDQRWRQNMLMDVDRAA